ncbi:PAS domain-containing protein [Pseudonocardia sp. H11422]|uniref:PAS domain-containing protein n=1 Tax=Pseudonocardia sp. H11422 TaxID=2835866 RepID=UPI001BDC3CA1|nr:PAS domain-containing protein [Pseudonocardia sp. H11422]
MASGDGGPDGERAVGTQLSGVPTAGDLARFWDLSLAMMGVGNYDGYFTLVNPAYQELLGWSPDELMSVPYWEFVHPDDRHALVESGEQLIEGTTDARIGYEVRMLGRDGSYRWTRWNTKAIPQEQLVYTIAVDLTGSRQDHDEHVDVGSWEWCVPADRFSVSGTLRAVFALTDDAPCGYRAFLQRVYPGDRRRVDRVLRASLTEAEPYSDDFRIQRPDGGIRTVHSAGRPIPGPSGEPECIRGITVAVTVRRQKQPTG